MDWIKTKSKRKKQAKKEKKNKPSVAIEHVVQDHAEKLSFPEWIAANLINSPSVGWDQLRLVSDQGPRTADLALAYLRKLQWGLVTPKIDASLHDLFRHLEVIVEPQLPGQSSPPNPQLWKELAKDITHWCTRSGEKLIRADVALASAALATALPWLVQGELEPELLVALANLLSRFHDAAMKLEDASRAPLMSLIAGCELPLILSHWLSDDENLFAEATASANRLALSLEQNAESPAPLLRSSARNIRAALACLARSRELADSICIAPWSKAQRHALSQLVVAALRFTRRDGSPILHSWNTPGEPNEFWRLLYELSGRSGLLTAAFADRMPEILTGQERKKREPKKLESAPISFYDEQQEIALFQKSWHAHGSRIAIDFSVDPMKMEIIAGKGENLLGGTWNLELTRNDKKVEITSSWQEVCYFHDEDIDYLELEAEGNSKFKLQRQILLLRKSGLVFLADAVLGDSEANWSLRSEIPLAPDLQWKPADRSRETWIEHDGQPIALVLPIACDEWKRNPTQNSVRADQGNLIMEHNCKGTRLYAPVVLALKREHFTAALTWRSLTVVENLAIQTKDVAVGYRVQLGKEQWVFYRSLAPAAPRTLLGCHSSADFFASTFDSKTGDAHSLVEVSPTE